MIVRRSLPALDVTTAWSLVGEAVESVEAIGQGTRSRVYRLTLADGGTRVVRLTPKSFQRVARERVARACLGGVVPTVAEVECEHPTLSREVDVVMMREVPGRTLAAELDRASDHDASNLWTAYGRQLAAIHRVAISGFGLLEGVGRAGGATWSSVASELGDNALRGARGTELSDLCDGAERALTALAPSLRRVTAASLIHGDAQPGNVQCHRGDIVAWFDLEYAMGADALYELAFVERFVELASSAHRAAFELGYGDAAPRDAERMAYYRIVHALRAWEFLRVAAPSLDAAARERALASTRGRLAEAISRS